ncbi:hypothetical protein [Ruminococcus flavefaciens]|uniref:hypothetical protein n=1 Tax=Ruminococcus flavefaciens TaxID=1265 RepID=UPI000683EA3E|nr:hypothetical protein [Ruminococcus flavefaciens]
MAFCKFCGKQIPDGGSCDCEAAKKAAETAEKAENAAEAVKEDAAQAVETVKEEAAQAAETVKEEAAKAVEKAEETAEKVEEKASEVVNEVRSDAVDAAKEAQQKAEGAAKQAGNGFKQLSGADIAKKVEGITNSINEKLPENVKKNKSLVYIAAGACAALLLCLILAVCSMGGGANGTAKKYINNTYSKKGGKTFYSLMLPKSAIKELKEDDDFDDMVDDYNDRIEDLIDDLDGKATVPKFDKISRKEKMKKSQLNKAEDYFESICEMFDADDDDITVTQGYELKIKTKNKDEDGDVQHEKDTICVVKVKGDGWKVIPADADSISSSSRLLRSLLGISSSFTSSDSDDFSLEDIFD